MRVLPKQFYLQLDTVAASDDPEHTLRVTDSLPSVLKSWTASTRISPVWRLRNDHWEDRGRIELPEFHAYVFIAGTNPSWLIENLSTQTLKLLGPDDTWLTIGAFNLMVRCLSEETAEELTEKAINAHKPIELWQANGNLDGRPRIELVHPISPRDVTFSDSASEKPASALAFEKAEMPADDTLSFMILEMYALTSVVETRSVVSNYHDLKADALGVHRVAAELLPNGGIDVDEEHEITDQKKRNLLLSLNAGLSRLASQALSGTSPITQTECHFWPHSMLGTGVANYALRNVTQFLTDAVIRNQYHVKYEANLTREFNCPSEDLLEESSRRYGKADYLSLKNQYFEAYDGLDRDLIEGEVVEKGLEVAPNPITFFSGRDGFKNTLLTTSAPLMSVAGSNCVRWNLGTISHEISHRIISGKLERTFKRIRRELKKFENYEDFVTYLRSEPATVAEFVDKAVTTYLANRVWEGNYQQAADEVKARFAELMSLATRSYSRETEEILVHIFDFYHFYGGEDEQYVKYVWHSWAVQPSIVEKLDDYILRTVLALASERFNDPDCIESGLIDFRRICDKEEFKEKLLPHVDLLTSKLSDPDYRDNLLSHLGRCHCLLQTFFLAFRQVKLREFCTHDSFFDPSTQSERIIPELLPESKEDEANASAEEDTQLPALESVISDDPIEIEGRRYKTVSYKYSARRRHFYNQGASIVEGQFQNPLTFLRDFSRDDEPDSSKSAWLLTLLAFNWIRPSTSEGE